MSGTKPQTAHLRKTNNVWELVVDGKPFTVLGAELQNSSMSSAYYMDEVWQNVKNMGINTVLGNICWEDIEPEEDRFDFNEMDKMIASAESYGLRMIILWFGSFKNGMSCYVPSWVKRNAKRFPRQQCRTQDGLRRPQNVLSLLHEENVRADCKAFRALMQHLKEMDEHKTVIMVQVENEVGLLGDSRDGSRTADKLFNSSVPQELVEFLATAWDTLLPELKKNIPHFYEMCQKSEGPPSGHWEELFGRSYHTDELFQAYHYAHYVEKVAAAGREVYETIPLFTNAWLPKPGTGAGLGNFASGGNHPGQYPSGGPVNTVLDVWYRFTPTLDFISPDIYSSDYEKTCRDYTYHGRPLFIPEQRRDAHGARRVWEALGSFQALGACPFGIDTLAAEDFDYTKHFRLLQRVSTHIQKARVQPDTIFGFYIDEPDSSVLDAAGVSIIKRFREFELHISPAFVLGKYQSGYGMIIELDVGRYLLIGEGYKVEFKSTSPTSVFTGMAKTHELSVPDPKDGVFRKERTLNGDETRSGAWINMPNEKPDYGEGYIPVTIPARTKIAQTEIYSLGPEDIVN
ncbi:uncharacterized protein CTRU02_202396 [Colletotrichum truncatum]|uniref:Uncharacterized protein n=1 Tax=Colletotrichum truncatum TaxID=5467 RepID=A0ACC3ZK58_COLTU|nr:uncharacterized protein CTRU02_01557 [Colletotrichum truncatum]KAF6799878.1 hypothetical protein CTRU02_01557 [Colletotrichum truncatum]